MLEFTVTDNFFAWVILPLLIFLARICDVSMGTLRVIFIAKGLKKIAPVIGFFEVIIWLLAIGQVMQNISNVASYVAYGGGFAAGTYLGMRVEEHLSIGTVIVRVITNRDAGDLVSGLRTSGYGVTTMDAEGSSGMVMVVLIVSRRQDLPGVITMIETFQSGAFYTIEEVRAVTEGVFPGRSQEKFLNWRDPLGFFRKGK
jgi:uncharacterized protein YebE (UPF0316 family)